jgi:hypothetical protein
MVEMHLFIISKYFKNNEISTCFLVQDIKTAVHNFFCCYGNEDLVTAPLQTILFTILPFVRRKSEVLF